jgi:hypothetical protein
VLALETLRGLRIVAAPDAVDALVSRYEGTALRFAPDEVFVIGSDVIGSDPAEIDVGDEHAIVVPESGFVGCRLDELSLAALAEHVDWPFPSERPSFAQGFIAGVPAKLLLTPDGALLVCAAPYAAELAERLR